MLDTHCQSVADSTHQPRGDLSLDPAWFGSAGALSIGAKHPPAVTTPGVIAITTWHVARVRTQPGEIGRIESELRQLGYDTYHPRFIERTRKGEELRPYFVGYLLFGVEAGDTWGEASRVRGVHAILGSTLTGRPAAIPASTIANWRDKCGPFGIHDPKPPGQPVRRLDPNTPIIVAHDDGPFAGLHALVRLDDGDRVQVLMDILGGERVVELPKARVAAV